MDMAIRAMSVRAWKTCLCGTLLGTGFSYLLGASARTLLSIWLLVIFLLALVRWTEVEKTSASAAARALRVFAWKSTAEAIENQSIIQENELWARARTLETALRARIAAMAEATGELEGKALRYCAERDEMASRFAASEENSRRRTAECESRLATSAADLASRLAASEAASKAVASKLQSELAACREICAQLASRLEASEAASKEAAKVLESKLEMSRKQCAGLDGQVERLDKQNRDLRRQVAASNAAAESSAADRDRVSEAAAKERIEAVGRLSASERLEASAKSRLETCQQDLTRAEDKLSRSREIARSLAAQSREARYQCVIFQPGTLAIKIGDHVGRGGFGEVDLAHFVPPNTVERLPVSAVVKYFLKDTASVEAVVSEAGIQAYVAACVLVYAFLFCAANCALFAPLLAACAWLAACCDTTTSSGFMDCAGFARDPWR